MSTEEVGGHTPLMSSEDVARIRRWHDSAYAAAKAEAGSAGRTMPCLGRRFVVPPEVHPIVGTSHLLGEAVLSETRAGDRVLDMGTGCGVNAVLAAATADHVVAVDNNPRAVEAARGNAERNGVADRVEVRRSDVFTNVEESFDLIVFDPPFRWFRPRDLLETASTDDGYRAMTAFFRGASGHLAVGGRMLIFFGTSGDLAYLRWLTDDEGFVGDVLAHDVVVKDGTHVDYYTFRMTAS